MTDTPTKGHDYVAGIAAGKLRSLIERIERLDEERLNIVSDIKDVKAEAKSQGFCVKTINAVLKLRKMDPHDRTEAEELLDLYLSAIGEG